MSSYTRELTKNWDIDVASELNDYLEELDAMCITFDGGKIKLNFAEAALLIQGSACIYSKKVELLYSLVYQTMDYVNHKNNKRDKQAGPSDKEDADGKETDDNEDCDSLFKPLDCSASEESQDIESTTPVLVVPLPPESLILPETHEKQKLPLISAKGEVLGSHKDFRINTFIPGAQDFILLSRGRGCLSDTVGAEDTGGHRHPPDAGDAPETHFGDGGGDDDFLPLQEDVMETEHVERQRAASEGRVLRDRRDLPRQPVVAEREASEGRGQETANMWKLHNLYDVIGEDQPLKIGKCYKVPAGLGDRGKRKREAASSLNDFRSWFSGVCKSKLRLPEQGEGQAEETQADQQESGNVCVFVCSCLCVRARVPASHAVVSLHQGAVVSDEELRRTLLQPEVEALLGGEAGQDLDDCGHAHLQGGDDDMSDNESEPLADDVPAEFGGGDDVMMPAGSQGAELSYEDLVKKSVEQFLVNSKGYAQETALTRRVKDWEDKIHPQLLLQEERPTFDIHDYGEPHHWGPLGPRGAAERASPSTSNGLDNFEGLKFMLASLQLGQGSACTLDQALPANDYTVEISSEAGLEGSLDTMGLTLLSTQRATERFKTLGAI
ncbi:hypothetical protein CRUP_021338 [Coryphaenoides rupestris]|nr:hypothetical protein CRUP_021338 [Coryphaenoides rupestris]